MSEKKLPNILIVDDQETSAHCLGLERKAESRSRHPSEVKHDDLIWADLVLMDFRIEEWPERADLDRISLQPINGLALTAVLREYIDERSEKSTPYTAFAIHTGHVGDISKRLHTTSQTPHVVARLNNLEWVFDKGDDTRFERSAELAMAVREISDSWEDVTKGGIDQALNKLLRLEEGVEWYERALDDVALCQVPLFEFSAGTKGLLFLRWLLHSILPYPTFLWAEHWVAAQLRISLKSLREVCKGESSLMNDLNACRYNGILKDFSQDRWWGAAIEQYAWNIRAAGAREPEEFHKELEKRAGISLIRVDFMSPVVCINRDFLPEDELFEFEKTVRLVPDLWPAYAGTAYATITSVQEDPAFAAMVHPLDRARLDNDEQE